MTENIFEMFDEVKDTITGFQGKVMAIADYAYGCKQILVQPPVKEDGDWQKAHWFDEPQLVIVKSNGGDKSEPRHGGERSHP